MYFKVRDMEYWYEDYGEGLPIVLLHGFTGSSGTWDAIVASRLKGFRIITVDLPGHGRTKGKVIKTMDACVADLHQLFRKLELKRFFLGGYSMGGRTALSYAVKYPEKMSGLILESASPGLADDRERAERRKRDEKLADRIEKEGLEAFVDYWENIPLFDTQKRLPKNMQQQIRHERLAQTETGLANSLRGMGTGHQPSHWESLKTLAIPVLLMVGARDEKFVRINEKMKEQLPRAEMAIFPDCGHLIHIEKPSEFAEALFAFAKRLVP